MKKILIYKHRPNEILYCVMDCGVARMEYGFLVNGIVKSGFSLKQISKMIFIDIFKKSLEEKNEDFIWIEKK
jgi:hypothetical protein